MIELSIPLLVSVCGLIMTAINVICKVYDVHKYQSRHSSQNPFLAVEKAIEEQNRLELNGETEGRIGNDFSRDIEIHIIVNDRGSVKFIKDADFDPDRFKEWADLHEYGLFDYELIKSYTMRTGVPIKCWKLYMWFEVESDLCQQEIQGLLPF